MRIVEDPSKGGLWSEYTLQDHLGSKVVMYSDVNANGTVGTNTGVSTSAFETKELIIPKEGEILGAADSQAGGVSNFMYGVGTGIYNADDAVKSIKPPSNSEHSDSLVNEGNGVYRIYNIQLLEEKGQYKKGK